ncbi:MAG TPA: hypothetical protein VFO19_05655 [Vicinamibacterales bacterium]|nr:hypothetical protein [Vicinamibacterales bacterium]
MFDRSLAVVLTVALTSPLAAQQAVVLDNHPEIKNQVRFFQNIVTRAVQNGGAQLAQRARQFVQQVELAMDGPPVVTGVYIPESGYHFDVQVPDILPSGLALLQLYMNKPQQQRPQGAQNVANTNTPPNTPPVAATGGGLVTADPMAPFEPDREYGNFVRNALVAAMLDNSGALPLKAGDRLTIRARVPQAALTNPLYQDDNRELLLSVQGEDLIAFRQGQITRDQAKERIKEYRY